jgi:hypothetical protein
MYRCGGVDCNHLVRDTDRCPDLVIAVIKLPSSINEWNFLTNKATVSFSRGTFLHGFFLLVEFGLLSYEKKKIEGIETVVLYVTPCSLVHRKQHFGRIY